MKLSADQVAVFALLAKLTTGFLLVSSAHLLTLALISRALGLQPRVVRIGFAAIVYRRRFGGTVLEVGCLPLGGFVKFNEPQRPDDPDPFELAPAWKRIVISLSPNAVLIAIGLALGADAGAFARGFTALTGLEPLTTAALGFLRATVATPALALGQLSLVSVAINLLPLPSHNGGVVVASLLGAAIRRPWRFPEWALYLGVLAWLALFGSLGVALVRAFVQWHPA